MNSTVEKWGKIYKHIIHREESIQMAQKHTEMLIKYIKKKSYCHENITPLSTQGNIT